MKAIKEKRIISKYGFKLAVLFAIFLLSFLLSVRLGSVFLSTKEFFAGLFRLDGYETESIIIYTIRLPRALGAILCGVGLSLSGVLLQAVTDNHLASPNIIGVKEASSDITKIARIKLACGPDFSVWSGNDDQIIPVLSLGGSGVISVLSNLYPSETHAMCQAALKGDYETAAALQLQFLPLIELLFCEVNPIPVKEALKCIGFDCGECRLPLSRLNKEHMQQIKDYFA